MKSENIVLTKTFEFAVRIVNLYKFLCSEHKEYVISKQLLRAGTSIGVPVKTLERWLKQLKDQNKIEFKGAPKTGGYYSIQN
ncbi:MAG: hypothetical protein COZ36_01980 [Piscirickettsiaceae bacterium CG_4_10_14_3_um_filter_44_349]|uniref:four helix bundle protein n=1 Tax=Shewanella vesiculosa TaxID=518738 RepID=UPI000CBF242B|nr:four helix bundle protein [Shewanella vesiculosa]NCO15045.1 four helix bundle protein [Thiomicrospira sp.]NCP38862.1 four helix bundle protein [Shewanella vesiculosa]PIX80574.1 MAG: hypothetical protein COZ36_01980 [Piscirickettsiaceae bacterium CG_4_10_14_3_um_filter_44_349]